MNDDVLVELHSQGFQETDDDQLARRHETVNHSEGDENRCCYQIGAYHPGEWAGRAYWIIVPVYILYSWNNGISNN